MLISTLGYPGQPLHCGDVNVDINLLCPKQNKNVRIIV